MVIAGRSMRSAIDAGTAFEAQHPKLCPYGYWPPAAESPADVMASIPHWLHRGEGERFEIFRVLPGTDIGCKVLEYVCSRRLTLTAHAIELMADDLLA